MKSLRLALLVLVLTSCSSSMLKAAKGVILGGDSGGGLNVETELTLGDKREDNDTSVQLGNNSQQEQTAESIVNETTNNNAPFWLIALGVLGWVLPTPAAMFKWAKCYLLRKGHAD